MQHMIAIQIKRNIFCKQLCIVTNMAFYRYFMLNSRLLVPQMATLAEQSNATDFATNFARMV